MARTRRRKARAQAAAADTKPSKQIGVGGFTSSHCSVSGPIPSRVHAYCTSGHSIGIVRCPAPSPPSLSNSEPLKQVQAMFSSLEPCLVQDIFRTLGCNVERTVDYLLSETSCGAKKLASYSRPSSNVDSLGSLPLDAFLTMCEYMNIGSLENLSVTSHQYAAQTQEVFARIQRFSFFARRHWPDSTMLRLVGKFSALTHLSFRKCSQFRSFESLPSMCSTSIVSLSLSECQVSDDTLERFLHWMTPLKELDLSCTSVTDEGLWHVRKSLPHLQQLVLAHCRNVTNNGIVRLLGPPNALRMLSLKGTNMRNSNNELAEALGRSGLECLDLSECRRLARWSIEPGKRPCRLRTLLMAGCTNLVEASLCCPQLDSLSFAHCPQLQRLVVDSCPLLTSISVQGCAVLQLMSLAPLVALETVDLFQCRSLRLSCLLALSRAAPELRKLNCGGLIQLTDAVLDSTLEGCSLLTKIDLGGAKQVSPRCLERILDTCARREQAALLAKDLPASPDGLQVAG